MSKPEEGDDKLLFLRKPREENTEFFFKIIVSDIDKRLKDEHVTDDMAVKAMESLIVPESDFNCVKQEDLKKCAKEISVQLVNKYLKTMMERFIDVNLRQKLNNEYYSKTKIEIICSELKPKVVNLIPILTFNTRLQLKVCIKVEEWLKKRNNLQ